MPGIANHTPTVGDTELARAFYTGRHADIVAATFDGDREVAPIDVAWVVGALTFKAAAMGIAATAGGAAACSTTASCAR